MLFNDRDKDEDREEQELPADDTVPVPPDQQPVYPIQDPPRELPQQPIDEGPKGPKKIAIRYKSRRIHIPMQ